MVSILTDSVRSFWTRFQTSEEHLLTIAERPEEFFGELFPMLQLIHPGLVAELGPPTSGRRELAISAGGCLDVFPAVLATTALVPELKHWRIYAFRQPKPDGLILSGLGFNLHADQLWFKSESSDQLLHLDLVYSGGTEVPDAILEQAAFMIVDLMVGEFTMEVYIGRCVTRRGTPRGERPLRDLPALVEAHVARVDASIGQRPWGKAV